MGTGLAFLLLCVVGLMNERTRKINTDACPEPIIRVKPTLLKGSRPTGVAIMIIDINSADNRGGYIIAGDTTSFSEGDSDI